MGAITTMGMLFSLLSISPFLADDKNFIRKASFRHVKPARSTKAFLHIGNTETETILGLTVTLKGQHKITRY